MDKILENIIIEADAKQVSDEETFLALIKESLKGQNIASFPSNIILRKTYGAMIKEGKISKNPKLEKILVTKKMRSLSGVSIITVLTKPWPCPGECVYCPTEADVPKSYLASEPAVMRAILCDYEPYRQVAARLASLKIEGHPTDKIELIVIGGTFSALPRDYQEDFIKECFRALNGVPSVIPAEAGIQSSSDKKEEGTDSGQARMTEKRFLHSQPALSAVERGRNDSLEDAKKKNEIAKHRCVGLTLETRPDYITKKEVKWFRYLGATRVELGVQSVFDDVLKFNKRGHGVDSTAQATKLLKDAGFKICYHMMPNLPGSNLEKDLEMFKIIFTDARFQPDYVKIYPCMVTKGSELYDLWKAGKYQPYSDEELEKLICEIKKTVPYHVRIMRLIRDIPSSDIEAGSKVSNLRQNAQSKLEKEGEKCKCIRCREIGQNQISKGIDSGQARMTKLFKEEYDASEGREIFLSYESENRDFLYALLRLRFPHETYLSELDGCAIIREVHTYGQQIKIGKKGETQHKGLGKNLIQEAEKISRDAGYKKVAVISGIGVRDYYKKIGYKLDGEYMVKVLMS